MKVVMVGGRNIAYHLTRAFLNKGHSVIIVNRDEAFCADMAKKFRATVVHGDGSDRHVIEQLELARDDLFVALTMHDSDNLVSCLLAKQAFAIENTAALVNDPDNKEVFRRMGIHTVVSPTEILATAIEDSMLREEIVNIFPTSDKVAIFRVQITKESPVLGKRIREAEIPEEGVIGAIMRGTDVVIPRGDTMIEEQDVLIVLMNAKAQTRVLERLIGEE